MSLPYSHRFIGRKALTGTAVFTCPAGHVAVLRDVAVYSNTTLGGELFVEGSEGQAIYRSGAVATVAHYDHQDLRQVIEPGETFTVRVVSGTWDVSLSGYLLTI
jgi:hypothetical protein